MATRSALTTGPGSLHYGTKTPLFANELAQVISANAVVGFLELTIQSAIIGSGQDCVTFRTQLGDDSMQGEAESRLKHFDRMKMLSSVVGSIAHDFNNLLVGVVCNAEMLQQYHPQTDAGMKCVNGILNTAEIVSGVTSGMLAFGGRHAGNRVPLDLNEVIATATERLRGEFPAVSLEFAAVDSPIIANVDRDEIEQSLNQLVCNAVEAIGDSSAGRVQITVGSESSLCDSDTSLFGGEIDEAARYAYFDVSDNGCGMPAEDIARLIEPLQSTRPGRVKGLGLAIVYSTIVFHHDGLLRVSSSESGTAVRALIPIT